MQYGTDLPERLIQGILQCGNDAAEVESAFKSIKNSLRRILRSANKCRHPQFVSEVEALQKEWEGHQKTFQSTLWQSKEVAAGAQALLIDIVDVFLPLLSNPAEPDERKAAELKVYQEIVQRSVNNVTFEFVGLTSSVKDCSIRWDKIQSEAKKYAKEDRIADKFNDICRILGSIAPSLESLAGQGIMVILQLFVRDTSRAQNHCDTDSDAHNLILRLTAICQVWAVLQADLQGISNQLQFLQDSTNEQCRAIRLRLMNNREGLYRVLADALHQYQLS